MISTRGRYALRVLVDLAQHHSGAYIPMKEVARRQGISLNYLERILPILMREKLIDGLAGKGGGYRLNRPASEYVVGHILRLTEGDLAPVACLGCQATPCTRSSACPTRPMWEAYHALTNRFFDSITVADLVEGRLPPSPGEPLPHP